MIDPLNPHILTALVSDGDDADYLLIKSAKRFLNEDRNLSSGLRALLQSYPQFLSELWQHDIPDRNKKKGADSWHIAFRDPPFSDLCIRPTSSEGVIDVYVKRSPILSFTIFDQPRNWQALLEWIWEYGDQAQIARAIPQLDPQKLSALGDNLDIGRSDRYKIDDPLCAGREAFDSKYISEKAFNLFNTFDDVFKPRLSVDKSHTCDHRKGWQKWDISFQKSPFRSLRVQSGANEGIVEVFGFDKRIKSFQMSQDPQSWKTLLDFGWKYGNKRHIAKAEYEASHPRPKTAARSNNKPRRTSKPLLHQVLRTAGFKFQREPGKTSKSLGFIPEGVGALTDEARRTKLAERQPLSPADPNEQSGENGRHGARKIDQVE